ncbi:Uncharacterised protein [Escherichia coli]|nr:Uncharacterised protein [Escherichia coli]
MQRSFTVDESTSFCNKSFFAGLDFSVRLLFSILKALNFTCLGLLCFLFTELLFSLFIESTIDYV